jgi:glycosyltransferase involved in cell wall biosynthesis
MEEEKIFSIMMCSRPGGDRGPGLTYGHHVRALNQDEKDRFFVKELWNTREKDELAGYDVYWFYAKGFDPRIYNYLKQKYPNKKYVFGPNVLLDKPDIGAADPWDEWFLSEVEFDLYIDQVEFYNNHVKKFLRKELVCKADYLDKCVTFDISEQTIDNKTDKYDCLLYSKKRRYDDNYEHFRRGLRGLLDENGVSYIQVHYGDYKREDYFDALSQSRCCVNLSLDECPGIATYEAMHMDTPIIGSPHNTPSIFDQNFWVHDTDYMTEKYLKRKEDAHVNYYHKIRSFLDGDLVPLISPREYILKHTSYQRYADDAYELMTRYCS